MSAQRRRSLGPEGNHSPAGASDTLQKHGDVSSSCERPQHASTRCPSRLLLLQCPQPLLLHLLYLTPLFATLSSPLFRLPQIPRRALIASLCLASLWPSSQSWPRSLWGRGDAAGAGGRPGTAPSFPPSLLALPALR